MSSITFVTAGDKDNGMGHVMRSLSVVKQLLKLGHAVRVVTPSATAGSERLTEELVRLNEAKTQGYTLVNIKSISPREMTVHNLNGPDAIVVDIEHGPSRDLLKTLRNSSAKVIVMGGVGFPFRDSKAVDELVDLQIYQAMKVNGKDGAGSNILYGAQYIAIDEDYTAFRRSYGVDSYGDGAIVTMGGGDPHNLGPQLADFAYAHNARPTRLVCGPAAEITKHIRVGLEVIYKPKSLAWIMFRAAMCVTALGMTVYEAMCLGLPVACTGWSMDHQATALELEKQGYLTYFGMWNNLNWYKLEQWIKHMEDDNFRREYYLQGRYLIDGQGARRIAEEIVK